ncbi:MAG TPA: HPr family phosphocarrier protein [Lentisphaeria bacterium]|nr:HPr family phosphocarrier protein [Lentisphaeria bacterium]
MNLDDANGFHLRPMAKVVQIASQFQSEVFIECNDVRANGKSILELMMLQISPKTEFTVLAYGDDSTDAVQAIREFFRNFTGD